LLTPPLILQGDVRLYFLYSKLGLEVASRPLYYINTCISFMQT
jgi:hypothetical protein